VTMVGAMDVAIGAVIGSPRQAATIV